MVYVKDDPVVNGSYIEGGTVSLFDGADYVIEPLDLSVLPAMFKSAEILSPMEWSRSCYGTYMTNADPVSLAEVFTSNGIRCSVYYDAVHMGMSAFISSLANRDPLILSVIFLMLALLACMLYVIHLICEKEAETIRVRRMFGQSLAGVAAACMLQVLLCALLSVIASCLILSYCFNLYSMDLLISVLGWSFVFLCVSCVLTSPLFAVRAAKRGKDGKGWN